MALSLDELKTLNHLLRRLQVLPAAARSRWIDTLPPGEAGFASTLREQLAALADDVETVDFLGTLPKLPRGPALESDETRLIPEPRPDARIGPFRLLQPLGEGGMGSVWLARREDGDFNREVALKLPHRHLLDRGLVERMRREREILAGLNHDHIARLYEAGFDEHGRPYLALEHVVGVPIQQYCATHGIELRERVRLVVQVVRAVAHAHANLVVHRDLKPGNILVSQVDGAARVKLLDFGIAKLLASDGSGPGIDPTQMLGRALTPDYASPEQVLEQPVTTASDIYSVGVVIYEVVAGDRPYKLKRQSASALAQAILDVDIVRPSRRAANGPYRREAARIAGDLDAIILKTLKHDPAHRYESAGALADDLERFLSHQPVLAQPDRWAYRAGRFVRRHALAVGAGAAIALTLVVGTGTALWQAREARIETAKARATKDFLVQMLTAGVAGRQGTAAQSKRPIGEVLEEAAKTVATAFEGQPEIRSDMQETLGYLFDSLGMWDAARAQFEDRLRYLETSAAPLGHRARIKSSYAYALGMSGQISRALVVTSEVIRSLQGAANGPEERDALAHALMNRSWLRKHDVADAAQAVRWMESTAPGSRVHILTLLELATAYAMNGNAAASEAALEQTLPLARHLPGDQAALEALVQWRVAQVRFYRGEYSRARQHSDRALQIIESRGGKGSFHWAGSANVSGVVRGLQGDLLGAAQYLEATIRVYDGFGVNLPPEYVTGPRMYLALATLDQGDPARARALAEAAQASFRAPIKSEHPRAPIRTRSALAQVLQAQGAYVEAAVLLREAIELGREAARSAHVLEARRLLASNHAYLGEHAAAETQLLAVIAEDKSATERFDAAGQLAHLDLAAVYLNTGRIVEAGQLLAVVDGRAAKLPDDERSAHGMALARLASLKGALALRSDDATAASRRFQSAVEILKPRSHPDSIHLATARADWALALAALGRHAEAEKLAQTARTAFRAHKSVAPHLKRSLSAFDRQFVSATR